MNTIGTLETNTIIAFFKTLRQDDRTALLQQMKEKELADKNAMAEKTKESNFAIGYDRICIQQDKEDKINKEKYLQQFRNENKRVLTFKFLFVQFFWRKAQPVAV